MAENPRCCENWLADFLRWTLPRSEAKESFIFWTGLFTLASVLRRHVRISKDYLGSWEVYPYMYLLFVGPSGSRKTTTANYNIELLNEVGGLTSAPDQVTVPKLVSSLIEAEECAMYINAGELSEFIAKSGVDMFSFLTKAFDGVKKISVGTHMRGVELGERPCINFLGATTPEWISDNIPQSVLDGGWGSRTLFIYEEEVRQRKLFYTDVDVKKLYDEIYPNLINDLRFISTNLFGDFKLTKSGEKNFEEWYIENADGGKKRNVKLKGYYERKPAYVMKVAMLLKIADGNIVSSDQLVLDWPDFEEAIGVIENVEEHMPKVFGQIGKNPYKADLRSIYEFIKDSGKVETQEVRRVFMSAAEPETLNKLINGLVAAGLVKITVDGFKEYLEVNKII